MSTDRARDNESKRRWRLNHQEEQYAAQSAWRARRIEYNDRRMNERDRVRRILRDNGPLTVPELGNWTFLGSRTLAEVLHELEDAGEVAAFFGDGPFPRRRYYGLVKKGNAP